VPGTATFTPVQQAGRAGRAWVSAWAEAEPFVDLVASWNLDLPDDAAVDVAVQVRLEGRVSAWYSLGRWSFAGPRASAGRQTDADGHVDVDVLRLEGPAQAFRLRIGGLPPGAANIVRLAGATVSGGAAWPPPPGPGAEAVPALDVPMLSQQEHRGTFPELGGGGASWCSPACTAMVLAYWAAGPRATELAAIPTGTLQPEVVHAAMHTYDGAYAGCGNWSFNVAYAARFGLAAYVARLRSLLDAEAYLTGGTPLVLSIACGAGELDGAPYAEGTAGHLLVLTGFTARGDPIVNDPAASPVTAVRRTYPREQLERAWLAGSGGIVYVIRPTDHPLPA
jgi:hypothetical protein